MKRTRRKKRLRYTEVEKTEIQIKTISILNTISVCLIFRDSCYVKNVRYISTNSFYVKVACVKLCFLFCRLEKWNRRVPTTKNSSKKSRQSPRIVHSDCVSIECWALETWKCIQCRTVRIRKVSIWVMNHWIMCGRVKGKLFWDKRSSTMVFLFITAAIGK